ncbi:MAG TPA: toll/interleukin-1 receptor domain-containing protein [Caulobacteraceae bacterium]
MKTYFLSYARADSTIALKLADDLKAAGTSVWVDQYDIHPSQHWDRAVEDAVRGCEGMIVILSPRSTASSNVADEVSVAIDSGKTVIPVLVEACTLPLRMTRMQFIDATQDYDHALKRCVSETSGASEHAPRTDIFAPAATAAAAVAEDELSPIIEALRRQLGPIAPTLVARENRTAGSREDLCRRLGEHIASPKDRDAFLKAVKAE